MTMYINIEHCGSCVSGHSHGHGHLTLWCRHACFTLWEPPSGTTALTVVHAGDLESYRLQLIPPQATENCWWGLNKASLPWRGHCTNSVHHLDPPLHPRTSQSVSCANSTHRSGKSRGCKHHRTTYMGVHHTGYMCQVCCSC